MNRRPHRSSSGCRQQKAATAGASGGRPLLSEIDADCDVAARQFGKPTRRSGVITSSRFQRGKPKGRRLPPGTLKDVYSEKQIAADPGRRARTLIMVALPLLKILKDQRSARKVSYNEPLGDPKGYGRSLDRQEAPSRCVVAPVIAALKGITSQAEGTAMDARGAPPLARRRCRARDYRLAHHRTHRPLESSQCRRGTPETHRPSRQPG